MLLRKRPVAALLARAQSSHAPRSTRTSDAQFESALEVMGAYAEPKRNGTSSSLSCATFSNCGQQWALLCSGGNHGLRLDDADLDTPYVVTRILLVVLCKRHPPHRPRPPPGHKRLSQ